MEERKLIWKIIGNGKSFFDKCKRDKINAYSAQSAFFIILSTIPFLMVFSSLLQYTPITEGTLLKLYQTALPDYVSAFLISITDEVYNRDRGNLVCRQGNPVYDRWTEFSQWPWGKPQLVCAKTLGYRLYDRVFVCSCIYTCSIGIRKYAAWPCSRVYSIAAEYHGSDCEISWLCAFWHFICIFWYYFYYAAKQKTDV